MAFCLLFPLLSIEISADSTESEKIERLCRFGQNLPLLKVCLQLLLSKGYIILMNTLVRIDMLFFCVHLNLHILFF